MIQASATYTELSRASVDLDQGRTQKADDLLQRIHKQQTQHEVDVVEQCRVAMSKITRGDMNALKNIVKQSDVFKQVIHTLAVVKTGLTDFTPETARGEVLKDIHWL